MRKCFPGKNSESKNILRNDSPKNKNNFDFFVSAFSQTATFIKARSKFHYEDSGKFKFNHSPAG